MRFTGKEFRNWRHKSITLLGMSGVGKTYLSNILRDRHWFHYSGDYRIGTRYMSEPILDNIKQQAMSVPFLRDLLRSDSIFIENNITVDHLKPLSSFLGKPGDPAKGGLSLKEFKRRLALHRDAEIAAMLDVPEFMHKARSLYDFDHFINDAGGSVCELDNEKVLQTLEEHTLILYIKTTSADETTLVQRAIRSPKPLYFRESFLDEQLAAYMQEAQFDYVAEIDPDEFGRWVFPKLFAARLPRYQEIADQSAYTISTDELRKVHSEQDFLDLVDLAVARHSQA